VRNVMYQIRSRHFDLSSRRVSLGSFDDVRVAGEFNDVCDTVKLMG
jgi:hypothetical protein